MLNKDLIRKNFARCAHMYDRYANVQRGSASRLLERVKGRIFKRILEVGCGTGNYTLLLRRYFPFARITAVDICEPMVEIARRKLGGKEIDFHVGDGEIISFEEKFDLITSNATFQWFSDLNRAVTRYRGLFQDRGMIAFSTFGPSTLWELGHALEAASGKRLMLPSQSFMGKEELEEILKKNLEEVGVEEEIFEESYDSPAELLKKIKFTGERGDGVEEVKFSPGLFSRLEEVYKAIFGQLKATYQIFYCKGKI